MVDCGAKKFGPEQKGSTPAVRQKASPPMASSIPGAGSKILDPVTASLMPFSNFV
jgi:hypothetical protein